MDDPGRDRNPLLSRVPRWAWWAIGVFVFVLVVPMLSFFVREGSQWFGGGDEVVRPAGPVRSNPAVFDVETLFELDSSGPDSSVPLNVRPSTQPRLEVVLPGLDGDVWVVNHAFADNRGPRVRRFSEDGAKKADFAAPFGATLFTPAPDGSLLCVLPSGETGIETLLRYSSNGEPLGEFGFPKGLFSRSLTVDPDGAVWAQSEEWSLDADAQEARLQSALVPVAMGDPLEVPKDHRSLALDGLFFGADGLLYRGEAVGGMRDTEWPGYTVTSYRVDGSTVATYTLPVSFRPYAADGAGRLYAERVRRETAVAQGRSVVGDPAGEATDVLVVAADGSRVSLRVWAPRYQATWAPSVWPTIEGRLIGTELRPRTLAVLRMTPSEPLEVHEPEEPFAPSLTLIEPYEPVSGDPYQAVDDTQRDILRLVHAGLVSHSTTLAPVPEIAESLPTKGNGGVSGDGRTISFVIREGISWHDGTPVTAADVEATWRYLRGARYGPGPEPFAGFGHITKVVARGREVVVSLSEPFGPGPESFFPYVLPGHLLPEDAQVNPRFGDAPVGCGPYRLARWEDGDGWYLRAHDGAPRGRPPVDKVHIRFLWGEPALDAYKAPESPLVWDWIDESVFGGVVEAGAVLNEAPSGRWWGIIFGDRTAPSRSLAVRRAVRLAYPGTRISQTVYAASETSGSIDLYPPYSSAHDPDRAPESGDDTRTARRELERDGWRLDEDGRMRRGRTTLRIQTQSTHREWSEVEVPAKAFEALQESLRSIGFDAPHDPTVQRQYESWYRMGGLSFEGFDAVMGLFPAPLDPGWGGLFDPTDKPSQANSYGIAVGRSSDPRLKALHEQARQDYDRAARARTAREVSAIVFDELVLAIPERNEMRRYTVNGPVAGFEPAPFPAGMAATVYDWSVEGAIR
jgi:peptide/nickel transport system substrate-binding protein